MFKKFPDPCPCFDAIPGFNPNQFVGLFIGQFAVLRFYGQNLDGVSFLSVDGFHCQIIIAFVPNFFSSRFG